MGYVVMRCAVLLLLAVASRSEAATCLEGKILYIIQCTSIVSTAGMYRSRSTQV